MSPIKSDQRNQFAGSSPGETQVGVGRALTFLFKGPFKGGERWPVATQFPTRRPRFSCLEPRGELETWSPQVHGAMLVPGCALVCRGDICPYALIHLSGPSRLSLISRIEVVGGRARQATHLATNLANHPSSIHPSKPKHK